MLEYAHTERKTKVQVVILHREPLRHILRTFWSTHLCNFATWEGMYSVFPVSTLCDNSMGVIFADRRRELEAYEKYVNRGFTLASYASLKKLEEFNIVRRIGDEYTRRVPFSGAPLRPDGRLPRMRFTVGKSGVKFIGKKECYSSDSDVQLSETD